MYKNSTITNLNQRINEMFTNTRLKGIKNVTPRKSDVDEKIFQHISTNTESKEEGIIEIRKSQNYKENSKTLQINQNIGKISREERRDKKKGKLDRIKQKLDQFKNPSAKNYQSCVKPSGETDSLEYDLSENEASNLRTTPMLSTKYLDRRNSKGSSIRGRSFSPEITNKEVDRKFNKWMTNEDNEISTN